MKSFKDMDFDVKKIKGSMEGIRLPVNALMITVGILSFALVMNSVVLGMKINKEKADSALFSSKAVEMAEKLADLKNHDREKSELIKGLQESLELAKIEAKQANDQLKASTSEAEQVKNKLEASIQKIQSLEASKTDLEKRLSLAVKTIQKTGTE